MLQPVHAPLGSADQVANLVLHVQTALDPALTLTSLAVRRFGRVEALVMVRMPDGGRESLSADDARLAARALRDEAPLLTVEAALRCPLRRQAQNLEDAADAADRQAAAMLAGLAAGAWQGVAAAREFGGRG